MSWERMVFSATRLSARRGAEAGTAARRWIANGAARRGVLLPGDHTPTNTVHTDYADLRGLAQRGDLRALPRFGYPLGRLVDLRRASARQHLYAPAGDPGAHLAVIGPTGSGKTSGLIVPWLAAGVRMGLSVVALDVKGDLLERTQEHLTAMAGSFGPISARMARWDYRHSASIGFNWIAELQDEPACHAAAEALLGRPEPSDPNRYFAERDLRLMTGLLEMTRHVPAPSAPSWTSAVLVDALRDQATLEGLVARAHSGRVDSMLVDALSCDPWDFPKLISGLLNVLAPLATAQLERVTLQAHLRLDDVLSTPGLLTIGAPLGDGLLGRASAALAVKLLAQRLFTRFGAPACPVLIVIDEAARISDRIDLEELLAICAGASATVALALQDLTQLPAERDRNAVLANCPTLVMTPGCSAASAADLARRLGRRPEVDMSTTRRGFELAGSGTTHSHRMVPVLAEREIMSPPRLQPQLSLSTPASRPAIAHVRALSSKPILIDLEREDLAP